MIGQVELPDDYFEDDSSKDHYNEDEIRREFALGRLSDMEGITEYDE